MANLTKIVLVGAVLHDSLKATALENFEAMIEGDDIVINPDARKVVTLESLTGHYNLDVIAGLANMSDDPLGIEGEYFTKLGSDTENFTAQKIYKCVEPTDQSNCFINNNGKRGKAIGVESGEIHYRKSTAEEIIKKLDNKSFSVGGDRCLLEAFTQFSGVEYDLYGDEDHFGDNLKGVNGKLVSNDDKESVHYQLPEDFDAAMAAARSMRKKELPEINGYQGAIEGDMVVYGCAKLPVSWFKQADGANRRIISLVLSSEITIDADAFEAIADYVN